MSEQSAETEGVTNDGDDVVIDVEQRVDDDSSEGNGLSEEDVEQIEREREERLAPENRPINSEVDNTQRDFDPETGEFNVPADEVENGPRPLSDEDRAGDAGGGSDDAE